MPSWDRKRQRYLVLIYSGVGVSVAFKHSCLEYEMWNDILIIPGAIYIEGEI